MLCFNFQGLEGEQLQRELLDLLKNKHECQPAPDMFDANLEKALACICVGKERCHPVEYGTRTHTLILVDKAYNTTYIEQDATGSTKARVFSFPLAV